MVILMNIPPDYDIHSLPWKDPPFLSSVNHLFLWAISHGELLNNQMVILSESSIESGD